MNWDPAALTVTGLIATFLSLIFAVAAHASTSKRAKERQSLRRMLDAREQSSAHPTGLPTDAANDPAVVTTPPTQSPPRARPAVATSGPSPAPAIPPAVSEPPRRPANAPITMFKRYTTQPQTPAGEPAAPGGAPKPTDESEPLWD